VSGPRAGDCEHRLALDVLGRQAGRGDQDELGDPRREGERQLRAHEPAHRVPEHDGVVDAELLADRVGRLREPRDRELIVVGHLGLAKPGEVERDAAVRRHERRDVQQPVLPDAAEAVDEQQRRAAAAGIDHVDRATVDLDVA
jgi:hypothetical protein